MSKLDEFKALPEATRKDFHDKFQDFLTNPAHSYTSLANELTEAGVKVGRKQMPSLMESLGFPKRSPEMVKLSRAQLGTQAVKNHPQEHESLIERAGTENLKEEYRLGSLNKIAKKYNTTSYVVKKALETLRVELRPSTPGYKEFLTILSDNGVGRDEIEKMYLDGRSFSAFREEIHRLSGYEISPSATYRMLHHLDIEKSTELIRKQQGKKKS